jgi:hypothetical protein
MGLWTLPSEEGKIKFLKIKIMFQKLALLPSSGEWRGRREDWNV